MTDIWPIIRFNPGPTDEQLEAERDAKHAKAVEQWISTGERRAYVEGYFLAIEMVRAVHSELLDDAEREERSAGLGRASVALGRKLALLKASDLIAQRARSFGIEHQK